MSTPAIPLPATARVGRAEAGAGPTGPVDLSKPGSAAHTILVYLFLFIPIVVVVVFSFNDTEPAGRPTGTAFQLQVVRAVALPTRWSRALPLEQLHRRDPDGDHRDHRRDDRRARPAAGGKMVPAPVRRPDLHQRHRPGDRDRPGDARLLRNRHSTSCEVIFGLELRFGHLRRSSRPTCCSTSASCCCSSGRACPAWTGPTSRPAHDLFGTPWRTFWQITLPAAPAGDRRRVPACRSRSASTTT